MAFGKRKTEYVYRHVYVATPAYDGKVDSEYMLSLAQACQLATINGINITAGILGNGAFIDLARCKLAQLFLEENPDCTHLFFIDGDLEFDPQAFVALVQSGKPVCAGAYRKRQDKEEYPIRWKAHKDGGLWVENGWVMCDRVATGFLCIERSVLERMSKERPIIKGQAGQKDMAQLFYTFINDDGHFMGEDFAWCDDYMRIYGEPIAVWPDFDFTHGGYEGNWNTFLEKEIATSQAEELEKLKQSSAA